MKDNEYIGKEIECDGCNRYIILKPNNMQYSEGAWVLVLCDECLGGKEEFTHTSHDFRKWSTAGTVESICRDCESEYLDAQEDGIEAAQYRNEYGPEDNEEEPF